MDDREDESGRGDRGEHAARFGRSTYASASAIAAGTSSWRDAVAGSPSAV